jgi:epoxyqueuosine reductase
LLAGMCEAQFRATYSGTPVTRAKRRGMARNAAVALGNSGDERAEPLLQLLLKHDEPLARGHAASALRQLAGEDAVAALRRVLKSERDAYVQSELIAAIEGYEGAGGGVAAAG